MVAIVQGSTGCVVPLQLNVCCSQGCVCTCSCGGKLTWTSCIELTRFLSPCLSFFRRYDKDHLGYIGPRDLFHFLGELEMKPSPTKLEVERILQLQATALRVKVYSPATAERAHSAWLGGSILGSLGSFPDMWVSKSEYDEFGASIMDRKCP